MTYRVGFYGGKGKTFRNRLVFPIQNAEGDLVAYGSPSLEEPGAIDYPPKFHPELEVYNLDVRHAVGELVLVESPLDVFALMDASYRCPPGKCEARGG